MYLLYIGLKQSRLAMACVAGSLYDRDMSLGSWGQSGGWRAVNLQNVRLGSVSDADQAFDSIWLVCGAGARTSLQDVVSAKAARSLPSRPADHAEEELLTPPDPPCRTSLIRTTNLIISCLTRHTNCPIILFGQIGARSRSTSKSFPGHSGVSDRR